MLDWIKKQAESYQGYLVLIAIGVIAWLSVNQFTMNDTFVRKDRYTADQARVEKTLDIVMSDVKEILKVLR